MTYYKPEDQVFQFLSTNGDGTGTVNAIGDYSSAQGEFYIESPSSPKTWTAVNRMLAFIEDSSGFSADNYGDSASPLTNGIRLVVKDPQGAEVLDLTGGQTIKSNAQWGQHCYDAQNVSYGVGNDFVAVRWTFVKSGNPVILQPGHRMSILLDDSFTFLVSHTFLVQGYKKTAGL